MKYEHIIQAVKKEQQENNFCEVCGRAIPKDHDTCKECQRELKENFLILKSKLS